MKRLLTSFFCAGMLLGAGAFADDMAKKDSMGMHKDHDKMMKDCVAQAEAKKDGMSKDDIKKSCRDQTKMKKDEMKKDDAMKKPS